MADENIIIEKKDGITITHYHNGETPPKGTVGELVTIYDGCNYSTKEGSTWGTTCLYCNFTDGCIIETWKKYQISDIEFAVIHESYIYIDPNIKRW